MLRDSKSSRRYSGKNSNAEEFENVPVNPRDSLVAQITTDPIRAPLNTIQEPNPGHTSVLEQDLGGRSSTKIERTPTKPKPTMPTRTPDKSAKNRFGWAQKNESSLFVSSEARDEGRGDVTGYVSQASRGIGVGNGGFGSMATPRSTRTMGRPNATSSYTECNSTQSTPTKSVSKPPNPGYCPASVSRPHVNGGPRVGNFFAMSKGLPVTCSSSSVVNTADVPHFDLKEDPSFWMEHNVQVLIRVRPLNSMERSMNGYHRCLKQESAQCITWTGQPETRFTFDHVACETVDQDTLFRMVGLPMVENCLSGYNSCMFAYGQTGSGKTFTMLGEIGELQVKPSPHRGMTPRIFEFLFARIRAEEESRRDERLKYYCKCSFLEIYNEQICDLLDPSSTNLLLREDTQKGVYVDSLSEFEVQTVDDILKLLSQGSANRKVASTNMNRESSRSHSVFTCVIESRWEKDAMSNLRFSRLNLVDLAGSERQKSSGAEGERLKEAANINKSLSTLGHVIMVLVDVANGKPKHVPYRDSRLTFLLQDSLGGNSKTMIIANVSPSICCAAETLNTLKFAQRAKLIQNNAVVNEDSSGDIIALQHQIQLLKEELSALKRQNVSRALSFGPKDMLDITQENDSAKMDLQQTDKCALKLSSKQFKSLECTLAGALRREKMSETYIKQLEAEIEQLNRLVRQREEDTRCTKMMLKFREDKIQRMESVVDGLLPPDNYLLEENSALSEEIQLLQAKVERNPEVTRFALENIRLLEQLRRFQDFYEEGEKEMLLAEVAELRDQLVCFLDGNSKQHNHPKVDGPCQEAQHVRKEHESLHLEVNKTLSELEECRNNLSSCLEENARLRREIDDLHASLSNLKAATHDHDNSIEVIKEPILEAPRLDQSIKASQEENEQGTYGNLSEQAEDVMKVQLEVDILNIMLKEERSSHAQVQARELCLNRDLEDTKENILLITRLFEDVKEELKEAKSVIEALESQQILSINEMEDLRSSNSHYAELLNKKELEISTLKEQISCHEFRAPRSFKCSESEDSSLQGKLKKMHDSLEKARRLNTRYQSDIEFQESNEEEMDEVRRQVEAETAEVIVCLQDEISILQQQVEERSKREVETEERLLGLQTELKDLQEKMHLIEQDNSVLGEKLEEQDEELRTMYKDEVRRQVEAETAEVIVCLQDEISILRLQVEESSKRKVETEERLLGLQTELKNLQEKMHLMEQENSVLGEKLEEKDEESRTMYKEWELLTSEIELLLSDGHEALKHASDQLDSASSSFPWQINEIPEQVGRIRKVLSEKEFLIENLNQCLEDADRRRSEMECMLRSLRGAALVITEAHQQECWEKEKEVLLLSSELNSRKSTIEELEKRIKHGEEEIQKASICTTAAFVIVNRFSEINSTHLDALEYKDVSLSTQTAEIDEAKRQIESLARELYLSKESCSELQLQLSQEQKRACSMEQKLEEARESDILQTTEKLAELKNGVSAIKYCMNEYAERVPIGEEDDAVTNHVSLLTGGICEARTGGETRQQTSNIDSYVVEDLEMEIPENPREYSSVQKKLASGRIRKDESDRDATIILLKKEIESALDSLKGVQAEIARLHSEKEKVWMSEKESKESIKSFLTQVLSLQAAMINFEEMFGTKMESLDHKLRTVEESVQNSGGTWCQEKELLELELGDAKAVAVQKAAEASCILAKFEEVQDTMKDADIMITELVIANETAKLQNEELKRMRFSLITEKGILIQEVQGLRTENNQKDCHYEKLEKLYSSDLSEMKNLVLELEGINSQVQTTFNQDFASIASEFLCMKSQLQSSRKLIHSWIEDIWSEVFVKDCALSVLHLCHMGILLETVTGLNAENGLLHHGLSESNSVMSELREHNFKSRRELEMCRILKGKLLADMKSGFDRISKKEDETSELTVKLTSFEKRLLDLQLQEESMLQRSNHMGSELAILTEELDLNNRYIVASQLDQEKYVKEQHEVLKSREENFVLELSAKDFELVVLLSELDQMALQKAKMEKEKLSCSAILQDFKRELILLTVDAELKESICVDKEVEVSLLRKEVKEVQRKSQEFLSKMNESNVKIADIGKTNEALEQDIQLLKGIALSHETLKGELGEVTEAKMRLLIQMQNLEAKYERLMEDIKTKEDALEISSSCISALDQQNKGLQDDISLLESSLSELQVKSRMKDVELSKMSCLEEENECLENELRKLKAEFCSVNGNLEEKKSEVESYINHTDAVDKENSQLLDEIISLKSQISHLKGDLDRVRPELSELQLSESVARDKLCSKTQDLQIHVDRVISLKQENVSLRNELQSQVKHNTEFLSLCDDSFANVEKVGSRISQCLHDDSANSEKIHKEMREVVEMVHRFMEELESLEELAKEVVSENSNLQMELSRKDDVLKGLLFDLSMLQESTSNTKDQKDEIEELAASINALEDEHAVKLCELGEAVSNGQVLEAQLQEKTGIICSLQLDISKMHETVESLSSKNLELTAKMENALEAKRSIEEELTETRKANETLEVELVKMEASLREMNNCIESLKGDLDAVIIERDGLQSEVLVLKENLEMARALAEENDAIAVEALETAECRKRYAEEKEEEVKLLERSVEELECTVNVLENKVDIVKREVERQRLEREELEVELEAVKQQMNHVKRGDTDIRRHLDEKEKNLQEAFQRIQILEREIAARDAEIAQCKVHITELNLHAEAQASEYKQKFKALEAMAEHVKPEGHPTHAANSPSRKLEKNASRSRGSGSPFKCIGLGLVQQMRDEELSAGRVRIEELEALAATRQKEIFMLNTKLAATESMTHDVIRDLLGVKLDMTNYASLLDNQQVQKITEKARLHNSEAQEVKDQEAMKLKQQLNEFIEERRGWLEEIDRKQAEVVAARVALEELHQRNHLITAEMEMCKVENTNQKRRIMELEAETKKLSGQQNLQQRIHHHAKIKEENNFLRSQNDDLTIKLRRSDAIIARVKEELAKFRASSGRSPFINFDEEQRLSTMLKETEEERLQLAQKLVGLCTSILKAAGITNPVPEVNLSIAEEALEQLKNRITSLERELQDVRFKNRITSERVRLSELMPQPSPLSSRADENRRTPNRASQTPFLSALDR